MSGSEARWTPKFPTRQGDALEGDYDVERHDLQRIRPDSLDYPEKWGK